jgi:hypothetical protein
VTGLPSKVPKLLSVIPDVLAEVVSDVSLLVVSVDPLLHAIRSMKKNDNNTNWLFM